MFERRSLPDGQKGSWGDSTLPHEGDISPTLQQKYEISISNKWAFSRPVSHRHICLPLLVHTTDESIVFLLGSEASIHHLSRTQVQHECLPLSRAQTCHAVPLPILFPGDLIEKWSSHLAKQYVLVGEGVINRGQSTACGHAAVEANSLHYLSLARHAKSAASHVIQHTPAYTHSLFPPNSVAWEPTICLVQKQQQLFHLPVQEADGLIPNLLMNQWNIEKKCQHQQHVNCKKKRSFFVISTIYSLSYLGIKGSLLY